MNIKTEDDVMRAMGGRWMETFDDFSTPYPHEKRFVHSVRELNDCYMNGLMHEDELKRYKEILRHVFARAMMTDYVFPGEENKFYWDASHTLVRKLEKDGYMDDVSD
jgi:hypothetical protein